MTDLEKLQIKAIDEKIKTGKFAVQGVSAFIKVLGRDSAYSGLTSRLQHDVYNMNQAIKRLHDAKLRDF